MPVAPDNDAYRYDALVKKWVDKMARATVGDSDREIPFSRHGWELRYLTWAMGKEGSPSFALGSILLYTGIDPDRPDFFRMVWMEPVK